MASAREPNVDGLLVIAGLLVVGVVGYVNYMMAKKRREAFAAFATQQGFSYQPENHALAGQWAGTPFQTGDNRRVRNVLAGAYQGRQIVAFDYSYQTHSWNGKGGAADHDAQVRRRGDAIAGRAAAARGHP